MLEYKPNELDQDFITCYSRYILAADERAIINDLEKLAEQGQINAIQTWYSLKKVGDNPKIDKLAESLSLSSHNERYVKMKMNRISESEKEYLRELTIKADEREPILVAYQRPSHTVEARESWKNFCNDKLIRNYITLINDITLAARGVNNYVLLQFANEIYCEYFDYFIDDEASIAREIIENLCDRNSEIIKGLVKGIKKVKSVDNIINDDPVKAFTFAKAVLLFNKKHKYKDISIEMLNKLADREYKVIKENNKR